MNGSTKSNTKPKTKKESYGDEETWHDMTSHHRIPTKRSNIKAILIIINKSDTIIHHCSLRKKVWNKKRRVIHSIHNTHCHYNQSVRVRAAYVIGPTHSLTLKHITWKKSYCIGARNHYQKIIHKTVHTIQYIKGDPVTDWKPIYLYSAPFRPWRTSSDLNFTQIWLCKLHSNFVKQRNF